MGARDHEPRDALTRSDEPTWHAPCFIGGLRNRHCRSVADTAEIAVAATVPRRRRLMSSPSATAPAPDGSRARSAFERIALLLQGGGALGAYQAGVYQALAESDLHPDWVAGISIGAI